MKRKPLFYNIIFILLIVVIIAFIISNSFTYSALKGDVGSGYALGFTLTRKSIIALLVLLISLPFYFVIKSHLNKNKANKFQGQ